MINISIAGIGGQGSVLAAKILAQAAEAKGWQVRTAETIGMAQRGGSVMSHVRMGNRGECVHSPLPAKGSVDMIIALEPGEGARVLPFLKKDGVLIVPKSGIAPTAINPQASEYDPQILVEEIKSKGVNIVVVDDVEICTRLDSRKILNIAMLAYALLVVSNDPLCENNELRGNLGLEEMREAIPVCVKEKFIAMNMNAIDFVEKMYQKK